MDAGRTSAALLARSSTAVSRRRLPCSSTIGGRDAYFPSASGTQHRARLSPGSVACCANQLRSLLRFLGMRGLADPCLADAVPSVGRWRDSGLPQFPGLAADRAAAGVV
jgi:hypothetical protein